MYAALAGDVLCGTPLERIRLANLRYIELYEHHAGVLELIEQVATFNDEFRVMRLDLPQRFITRIERAVRRILADGQRIGTVDARVLANALGGMVDNFCFTWFVLEESFDRDVALRTVDEIWARVLGLAFDVGSEPSLE